MIPYIGMNNNAYYFTGGNWNERIYQDIVCDGGSPWACSGCVACTSQVQHPYLYHRRRGLNQPYPEIFRGILLVKSAKRKKNCNNVQIYRQNAELFTKTLQFVLFCVILLENAYESQKNRHSEIFEDSSGKRKDARYSWLETI